MRSAEPPERFHSVTLNGAVAASVSLLMDSGDLSSSGGHAAPMDADRRLGTLILE